MLNILSVLNLVLCLGLAIGGLAAFRHGFTRTANEVQERVIHALESEINALKDRLSELERENARLTDSNTFAMRSTPEAQFRCSTACASEARL